MVADEKRPLVFLSYARLDNKDNRLTQFREELKRELSSCMGQEVDIFMDIKSIKLGKPWREALATTLDQAFLIVPILTAGFFKSKPCREEIELFLAREKKLERKDLIYSVYYIDCPVLNEPKFRKKDSIAEILASRQYMDWRENRLEPYTNPAILKQVATIAQEMCAALGNLAHKGRKTSIHKVNKKITSIQQSGETEQAETQTKAGNLASPTSKTAIPTFIVDAMPGRGDFTTINEAVIAAQPGSRILVKPGHYEEGLILDKQLEIIGDGDRADIVIQAVGKSTIQFRTTMGRVVNFTLRQAGGGKHYGIDIGQGRLELEDCDIISKSLACVAVHSSADPRLRRNIIHEGKQGGIFVYDNGQGTFEDNDIFGNEKSCISVSEDSNPTFRRNRIHDGKQGGIFVYNNGKGTFEDNDIFGNALPGITVKEYSNPTIRRNRIHDGKQSGIFVHSNGQGTFEDNNIFANGKAGISVKLGGNPTVRRNIIYDNKYNAVWIYDGGQGTFEDNDLRGNKLGVWDINQDCLPNVTRKGNIEK